ncbi:hypothetical protein ACH5RR_018814 [Cinchona calisaya]|uniref:CDP-diacylglycerol--glycerol-3-phosphate 1-phosphatidyltransferase n=1 Tax=Cinchona calisaya TaxID=153742 RepID=A0ABD2ZR65_9GENT
MPPATTGLLKLTSISSLYHHRYSRLLPAPRNLSSSTTVASRRLTHPNSTTTSRWWCRIRPSASSTRFRIHNPSYKKFLHSSTSLEQKGRGYNSHYVNNDGLATHMGPTPSDDHHHHHDDDDGKKPPPPPPPPSNSSKLLTLPTVLTIGRVAAVPLLVATFYVDSWWGPNATTGIFTAAAITDWLDGYLARKMKQGTAFGAFLDPVADKLMVAATLVLLCTKPLEASIFGQAPWLLTVPAIAIIGREITMSAVREWAASQDGKLLEAVAVNNLGKWKTATQMTALTILLAARDTSLIGAGTLVASGVVLLHISAWLSLWSLFVYMRKIWKVLLM